MRLILKRDGTSVEFDKEKILSAIRLAYLDCEQKEVDVTVINTIADSVSASNLNSVEDVQDMIEMELMKVNPNVAKNYIIYRQEKSKEREHKISLEFLSDEFLSKYKKVKPPLTDIGMFTFIRTYSRYLPELGRRENYWEACARTVNANIAMIKKHKELTEEEHKMYCREAEELFDNMFNARQFLSGRLFWTGGTKVIEQNPMSVFNCSFTVIEQFDDFAELMYLLMLGCGVGYRVFREDMKNLTGMREVTLTHATYKNKAKERRWEHTRLDLFDDIATIYVGDSKNGWSLALKHYFDLRTHDIYRNIKHILINYDSVRPVGEPLKTFGGTASGHEALKTMIDKIHAVTKDKESLRPIDALDICGSIAQGIVVGGVRRSALICLMEHDEDDVVNAKSGLYECIDGKWTLNKSIDHRQLSNNSVAYEEKPTYQMISDHIDKLRYSGEPGFDNMKEARKRFPNAGNKKIGFNPCNEIILTSKGLCNLTTVNVLAFLDSDGNVNTQKLFRAQQLSARAGLRMTLSTLELRKWDESQKEYRLLGCSLTGWQDLMNITGERGTDNEVELLNELRDWAINSANMYADDLGINPPANVTTIKPEGTLSLLPTVSSGVHFSHSEYYIRRVRISSRDPLCKLAEELGYPIHPEVGMNMEDATIKVVEFPVKSASGRMKADVSAIEQLNIYLRFQKEYTQQNTSITIHVRNDEWEDVKQWVFDNWDNGIVGISFLSYDDSYYELLPYEECSKEEYEKRKEMCRPFKINDLKKYENRYEEFELDSECASGLCPTR